MGARYKVGAGDSLSVACQSVASFVTGMWAWVDWCAAVRLCVVRKMMRSMMMSVVTVATTMATAPWTVDMDVDWSLTRLRMTMAIAMHIRDRKHGRNTKRRS